MPTKRKKKNETLPSRDQVEVGADAPDLEEQKGAPRRTQQTLPGEGFAPKDIPQLTALADKHRSTRDSRLEIQRKEKAARDERNAMLRALMQSGELKMPPPEVVDDLEKRPIYRYLGADGRWHEIVWCEGFEDRLVEGQDGGADE
jgi:hypothetical protein